MQVFAGHTSAVQCGDFTPDGSSSLYLAPSTADAIFVREKNSNGVCGWFADTLGSENTYSCVQNNGG